MLTLGSDSNVTNPTVRFKLLTLVSKPIYGSSAAFILIYHIIIQKLTNLPQKSSRTMTAGYKSPTSITSDVAMLLAFWALFPVTAMRTIFRRPLIFFC